MPTRRIVAVFAVLLVGMIGVSLATVASRSGKEPTPNAQPTPSFSPSTFSPAPLPTETPTETPAPQETPTPAVSPTGAVPTGAPSTGGPKMPNTGGASPAFLVVALVAGGAAIATRRALAQ